VLLQGFSKVRRAAFQAAKGRTRLKAGKDAGGPSGVGAKNLQRVVLSYAHFVRQILRPYFFDTLLLDNLALSAYNSAID